MISNFFFSFSLDAYSIRLNNFLTSHFDPVCQLVVNSANSLIDSISNESLNGLEIIQSPLVMIEKNNGEMETITIDRLMLKQMQHITQQSKQMHSIFPNPNQLNHINSNNTNKNENQLKRGLVGFQLYKNPTQILFHMQNIIQKCQFNNL
jgi:hypothetical protein